MSLVETVPKKILPMETTNYLYKGKLESGFQTNSVNTKNDGSPTKQVLADNGYTQEESYNSQAAFKSFAETVPKQMFSADQDIPESIDVPPEKFNSYSGSSVDTDFSAPEITQPKKVADESLNTEEEPHNVQVNAFATDVLSLLATENLFSLCITPVDSKPQSGTSPLVPLPRSRSCTNRKTTPKQLVMRQTSMQPTRSQDETRMIQPTQFKPQLGASPTIPKIPDDSTVQSTEELTDQPVPDDRDTNSLDSEHPTLSSDDNQIEANLGICLLELRTLEKRIAERDDEVALTFSRSLKFDSLTVANYPQVVEEVISLVTTCISQSMPATAINLICHIIKMISVFRPNDKLVKLELCAKLTMHVHKGGKLEVRTRAMEVLNAIVRVVRRVKEASSRLQSLTEAYCLCCIGQCYYTKRENETAMHHYIASMEILNENLGIAALTAQQIRLHYHIALVYERIGKLRQAHGELDIAKAALQNCTEVDEKVKKELMADIELRIVNCNNVTPDCSVHQLISSIHSAMHVGRHLEVTVKCRRLANLLQSEPIRNLKMLTKNLILTASKLAKAGRIHDAIQIFSQILSLLEVDADPSTRFENLAQLILQIRHVSDMAWLHGKKPFLSQLLNIINEVTGFADSSNATKSLLPKCVDYLSICYFYNGDYDKTVEMSTKAEETSESTSGQSYQFSGWCHYNKGLANFMMKKYKNAILNFVQAHSCFDLLGTQSWARKMALNSNTWINHLNTLAIGEL
uniref:Cell division cycle protein 27 homolog n=1 Tax=Phallusia mammillata TaxID=59560 RepID=A0A6F9D905_9ASCI|nr:cell division cycle protein 27 homolog [Phallusia mammillata]